MKKIVLKENRKILGQQNIFQQVTEELIGSNLNIYLYLDTTSYHYKWMLPSMWFGSVQRLITTAIVGCMLVLA